MWAGVCVMDGRGGTTMRNGFGLGLVVKAAEKARASSTARCKPGDVTQTTTEEARALWNEWLELHIKPRAEEIAQLCNRGAVAVVVDKSGLHPSSRTMLRSLGWDGRSDVFGIIAQAEMIESMRAIDDDACADFLDYTADETCRVWFFTSAANFCLICDDDGWRTAPGTTTAERRAAGKVVEQVADLTAVEPKPVKLKWLLTHAARQELESTAASGKDAKVHIQPIGAEGSRVAVVSVPSEDQAAVRLWAGQNLHLAVARDLALN
jgi:hypothetical protein